MVLVELVLPVFAHIDQIEECDESHRNLGVTTDSSFQGEGVLVIPSPPSATNGLSHGHWRFVTTTQPGWKFCQFHLTKSSVGLSIPPCRIVRSVHLCIVLGWILAPRHVDSTRILLFQFVEKTAQNLIQSSGIRK